MSKEDLNIQQTFVRVLKEEMARQGINQKDLARILACTEANVGQMLAEDRTHGMRLRTVGRLAETLGCRAVLVLIPESGAERLSQWEEEARREGVTLWDWLSAAVKHSLDRDTVRYWLSQGFPTRIANALANARIRSWSQLEALDRKELLALRDLGKVSAREVEERLARRREKAARAPEK